LLTALPRIRGRRGRGGVPGETPSTDSGGNMLPNFTTRNTAVLEGNGGEGGIKKTLGEGGYLAATTIRGGAEFTQRKLRGHGSLLTAQKKV